MFNSDIDALVYETFNHAVEMKGMNPFDEFKFDEDDACNSKENPEHAPGVIYHLEKKSSTFVIRIHTALDLAEEYRNILEKPENYSSLRLLQDDETKLEDKVKFFQCDSLVLANEIKKELGNKRFPIHEEHIFNVSDPADSWWASCHGDQLKIYFKLSSTHAMEELIKIGPLGDADHAIAMFNKLYGYFQMIFPIADYASAHGQLSIKSGRENDPIYKAFTQIFLTGDADHDFWQYLRDLEIKSYGKPYLESLQKANFFLMQISSLRRFWVQIQSALEN